MDIRILRLRIELSTAAQTLTGEDADEFWKLIDEVQAMKIIRPKEHGGGK